MQLKLAKLAVGLAAVAVCGAAQATFTEFFAEDINANFGVGGTPKAARMAFDSALGGLVGVENFDSFSDGAVAPLSLDFLDSTSASVNTAQLTGDGVVANDPVATSSGRFATSGANWWDATGDFSVAFGSPVSAFGFYATDLGDFQGSLTIELTDSANNVTTKSVPNTIGFQQQGALLFWGFIDTTTTYKQVTFTNVNQGSDFFGVDDLVVGATNGPSNGIPEPATLALLGLGLLGVGAARRRAGRA